MRSARTISRAESESAARLAAKYDLMTLNCVTRVNYAHAEAVAAIYNLVGSHDRSAISDRFEKVLHAGFQEALQMLPPMPISRGEFDALPVLPEGEDSSGRVGLCRTRLRSWWIIIHANSNGTGVFYRPDILDGPPPLH
jgi:hypothetical protein